MASNSEMMTFKTAGYSLEERLNVYPRHRILKVDPHTGAKCGVINDGVVFQHDDEGVWCLSFKDLEAIYLRAKELNDGK